MSDIVEHLEREFDAFERQIEIIAAKKFPGRSPKHKASQSAFYAGYLSMFDSMLDEVDRLDHTKEEKIAIKSLLMRIAFAAVKRHQP